MKYVRWKDLFWRFEEVTLAFPGFVDASQISRTDVIDRHGLVELEPVGVVNVWQVSKQIYDLFGSAHFSPDFAIFFRPAF